MPYDTKHQLLQCTIRDHSISREIPRTLHQNVFGSKVKVTGPDSVRTWCALSECPCSSNSPRVAVELTGRNDLTVVHQRTRCRWIGKFANIVQRGGQRRFNFAAANARWRPDQVEPSRYLLRPRGDTVRGPGEPSSARR